MAKDKSKGTNLTNDIQKLRDKYGLSVTIGTGSIIIFHGLRPATGPKEDDVPINISPNRKPN